jgi:hypothetical protein
VNTELEKFLTGGQKVGGFPGSGRGISWLRKFELEAFLAEGYRVEGLFMADGYKVGDFPYNGN